MLHFPYAPIYTLNGNLPHQWAKERIYLWDSWRCDLSLPCPGQSGHHMGQACCWSDARIELSAMIWRTNLWNGCKFAQAEALEVWMKMKMAAIVIQVRPTGITLFCRRVDCYKQSRRWCFLPPWGDGTMWSWWSDRKCDRTATRWASLEVEVETERSSLLISCHFEAMWQKGLFCSLLIRTARFWLKKKGGGASNAKTKHIFAMKKKKKH